MKEKGLQESILMNEESVTAVGETDRYAEVVEMRMPRRKGLSLAEVERGERPHRCGKCMNPFLRAGNPECPRLAQSQEGALGAERPGGHLPERESEGL